MGMRTVCRTYRKNVKTVSVECRKGTMYYVKEKRSAIHYRLSCARSRAQARAQEGGDRRDGRRVERVADRCSGPKHTIALYTRYFRRLDLALEDRVGLFGGGSKLPPRSRSLFLLFPEDAKR